MNYRKFIMVIGMITMIIGLIFHLQGQSIIGPESSFMYSNPQWITYGIQIIILGGIILVTGFGIKSISRN